MQLTGAPLDAVVTLARLLASARHAVIFTGAGMSTESGIPDFRSPGGVWSRLQPIQFGDFVRSPEVRHEDWRRVFSGERGWNGAQPNAGHRILAHWMHAERVRSIITQNVDGLHQRGGAPGEHVIELHGNAGYARCLGCGARAELEDLRIPFELTGFVPPCQHCGGLLKLAVISFGQDLPPIPMARAEREALAADLFIVLGSSLEVYPAAGFPELAAQRGAALAIINREPTPLDAEATVVIHAGIGQTLAAVDAAL